jgi:hypothetical protein
VLTSTQPRRIDHEDPITRLEFARGEIDRMFGRGYSRDHPDLTAAVMLSASLDFHGLTLARAVRDVAIALLEDSSPPEMTACFVGPRSCARSRFAAERPAPIASRVDEREPGLHQGTMDMCCGRYE